MNRTLQVKSLYFKLLMRLRLHICSNISNNSLQFVVQTKRDPLSDVLQNDEFIVENNNDRKNTNGGDGGDGEDYAQYKDNQYKWIENALKQCDKHEWKTYLNNFKQNKITDDRLNNLKIKEQHWQSLIPEIGVRIEFQELLDRKIQNQ